MRHSFHRYGSRFGSAVVAILLLLSAHSAFAQDLAGKYTCRGVGNTGEVYRGEVTITKQGQGYRLDWKIGREEYNGVGFIENDRLVASWLVVAQGQVSHGVISYKINENGVLEGKWTDPSARGIYTEILTPHKREGDQTI